ncbi:MAG TPA: S9 family peptidase [Gemmatimonadaceae bacterium]|nr:S9 family peptidase [Gemmatimonadaceae bacterium]
MRRNSAALAVLATITLLVIAPSPSHAQAKRPLRSGDLYHLKDVRDPELSPDGAWVAYTVTTVDSAKDKSDNDVWMTSWDGATTIRVTSSPESESSPRWSPDGRYLAFLSGRQEGKGAQIWLLDRRGGEAQRVTQLRGGVSEFAWSPDSKRMILVVDEETDSVARKDTAEHKAPKPIVIDRYSFKRDVAGYLGTKRSHLSIFDVDTKKTETLTSGLDDDGSPSWSPDNRMIAFVRGPVAEPDHSRDDDVYVIEARAGATPKRLTDFAGPDGGRLAWSPDGKWLAFFRGDEPKYQAYNLSKLAIVPSDGSAPARVLTEALDRPLSNAQFTADGKSVYVLLSDDREQQLARVRVADGSVERLITGKRVISAYTTNATGKFAVMSSTPERSGEVYAWDNGSLRQLSHQNDSIFAQLQLGSTEGFSSKSKDGTEVHGVLVRPANAPAGKLPMILYIHGGPNGQDSYSFSFDREYFAANGYAVLSVNYRGSSGRGAAYQKAIFADWGDKEVMDLLGAVDEAVRSGVADAERLGIGGWSYGGILTDYTIASTTRFKAGVAGAGSALQLSMYGTDQYITQYNQEIGPPWKAQDLWIKISYPFFHADRIKTPTLFMGGSADFNVPIIGGEQMYQALRSLGVPTELVIYPGQFHGLTLPTYRKDRLERFLAWYDKYLKTTTTVQAGATKAK